MPSTQLFHDVISEPDSCEVTVCFEYDDPDADAALAGAQKYRLAGIAGQLTAWVEGSLGSDDPVVSADQHHYVRAVFSVPCTGEQDAADWLVQQMRTVAPGDDIDGVAVNGRWLSTNDWA